MKLRETKLSKAILHKFDWDVNDLTAYVDEQSPDIIPTLVVEGRTAKLVTIQEGIKFKEKMKLLDTEMIPQAGGTCDRNPLGGPILSDKTIEVSDIKYNIDICNKDLIGNWGQLGLKPGAMIEMEEIPFGDQIIAHFIERIHENNEMMLWQGDKLSANPYLNKIDGIMKIMKAGGVVNVNSNVTAHSTSNIIDSMFALHNSLPTKVLKAGAVIFVGLELFDMYCQASTMANQFHFNPENNRLSVRLHGTNTMIELVEGLTGTNEMYAGVPKEIVIGTDLENDFETFSIVYSREQGGKILVDIEYRLGVQFAYADNFRRFELVAS